MKREYSHGKQTREKFERTMTKLFRAPKTVEIPANPAKAKKKGSGQ
jgi:hypothetical protein